MQNKQSFFALAVFAMTAIFVPGSFGQSDKPLSDEQAKEIISKTLAVKLAPDLSHLSDGEKATLDKLMAAGELMHELFLQQRHSEAIAAYERIKALPASEESDRSRFLFWISKGPVVTTLDNKRVAAFCKSDEEPGKTVYPPGIDTETLDKFIGDDARLREQLLHDRSVVRESTEENLAKHRATMKTYPQLAFLNPDFKKRLEVATPGSPKYYAVPYAIEYANRLTKIYELLNEAAGHVEADDSEFATYLRHRARDLLCSDYEAGDAAWITGRFKNINAEIGSYETYDDTLYGVKAFYAMSILVRDPAKSAALNSAIKNIQSIENSLPYKHQKSVRSDIPVHVCNVVADFGQSRGANTATILPNDAEHSRKYGRTILLRNNIMMNPDLFATSNQKYRSAVAPKFREDLTIEANFQRTLWHEVGHYLGVDRTESGQSLDESLGKYSDLFEEMKADLVSLFSAKKLADAGVHSAEELKAIYAGGVLRVLQTVKPRMIDQPYQTMQVIQWNYYMGNGVLSFDEKTGLLSIDYDKYHATVEKLLGEVLAVQRAGNLQRAAEFVEKHTEWREDLHEVVANRLRGALTTRFTHVSYEALEQ